MREAQPLEQAVGMRWYVSERSGIGGKLKTAPDHFHVTELEADTFQPIDADPADYPAVIVRVTLEDWDTFGFARRFAREIGIHHEAVRWAGTKDKSAITTQLFSFRSLEDEISLPDIPGASISLIGRSGRQLGFGDLLGNEFSITVAEPTAPEQHEPISEELRSFGAGEIGVPNYFGQQRFGSIRPVTHTVGLAILTDSWEEAVLAYVGNPSDDEPVSTQEARRYVDETRDWEGALERFPPHLTHERRMCRSLSAAENEPQAFREALDTLSHSLQQLFIHAVQSVLFNEILSERLAREIPFTKAIVGDTVCFGQETDRLGMIPDPDRTQRVTADRLDTINRHIAGGRAFITAPLIGTETELSSGTIGDIERSVLERWGITASDFALPEPYATTGHRRAILVQTRLSITEEPLTFSFGLPSGSYATVVMREYLKVSPAQLS